jgi:hypothetical protein
MGLSEWLGEQPNATVRLDSMKAIDQERNAGSRDVNLAWATI